MNLQLVLKLHLDHHMDHHLHHSLFPQLKQKDQVVLLLHHLVSACILNKTYLNTLKHIKPLKFKHFEIEKSEKILKRIILQKHLTIIPWKHFSKAFIQTAKFQQKHFSEAFKQYTIKTAKLSRKCFSEAKMSDGKVLSSDELPSLPQVSTPTPPLLIFKPTKPPKTIEEQIQEDYHPDL